MHGNDLAHLNGTQSCRSRIACDSVIHVLQVRVPRAAAVRGKVAAHLNGLEADIAVLRRLQHPNIVRYLVRMPT